MRPHVVRYEGGNLVAGVVDGRIIETTPEQVPDLAGCVGKDIVCSDGSTLLGADDKAGVAEICSLAARLLKDPSILHPTLKLAFVPDEEIGHGAALLDLESSARPGAIRLTARRWASSTTRRSTPPRPWCACVA